MSFLHTLIVLGSFFFMEFVAWFMHKYMMYGFLWTLHKDHHYSHKGFFEWDDYFFLIFAIPSCLLLVFGSLEGFDFRYWIGIDIALYGLIYFIIHDLLIHQWIKGLPKTSLTYLKAIKKAHARVDQGNLTPSPSQI